jgi:hypothetical protein
MMDDATLEHGLRARPPADPMYQSRITADPPTRLRTVTTRPRLSQPGRSRPMLTATRLVVAAAAVSLGGGALLLAAGQGPSPTHVVSPLPWAPPTGLVTEPVEPGVVRIIGDDAGHDIASTRIKDIAFAPDGAVWMFWEHVGESGLFQVGDPGVFPGLPNNDFYDLTAAPDGRLWGMEGQAGEPWGLASFDGHEWTSAPPNPGLGAVKAVEVMSDGTVWAAWDGPVLGRLDDGAWTTFSAADEPALVLRDGLWVSPGWAAATSDGSLWVALARSEPSSHALARFDGETWEPIALLDDGDDAWVGPLAIGPDGSLWAYVEGCAAGDCAYGADSDEPHLARFDGQSWTVHSAADGVPRVGTHGGWVGVMVVGADGTVWVTPTDYRGLMSFDGSTWRRWLASVHSDRFRTLAAAPDGSVWAPTSDGAYILRP